nr:hypothetical protein CFP56_54758 [Quercus suber]
MDFDETGQDSLKIKEVEQASDQSRGEGNGSALFTPQAIVASDDKDFNTRLNEIDAELAKYDNIEESNLNSNKTNSCATSIDQNHSNLNDSCDPKELARVSNSVAKLRVLLTWSRKTCDVGLSQKLLGPELLSGRKRQYTSSSDSPSKRQQTI